MQEKDSRTAGTGRDCPQELMQTPGSGLQHEPGSLGVVHLPPPGKGHRGLHGLSGDVFHAEPSSFPCLSSVLLSFSLTPIISKTGTC